MLPCAFIDMLSIGLAVPVLPVLVGEFVEGHNSQVLWFGILTAVFGLMQLTCMPLLGGLSDRIGRRPVLMISMAGMSINFMTTAWAPNLACLFIGRIVGGMSAASSSVIAAYASDVSLPEQRARSYGQISAALVLGFICGPILGGVLGSIDIRLPFVVASAFSAINLVYGCLFIPESLPVSRRVHGPWRGANPIAPMIRVLTDARLGGAAWVFLLVTFANLLMQTTWVLYTAFRFAWTPSDNGVALFVMGIGAAVVQAVMLPWLLRQVGEKCLILLGLICGTLACVLFGFSTEGWMMYAIMPINLLAFVVTPILQGTISKASTDQELGVVMASLQSIGSLGVFVIPLLGAVLLQRRAQFASNDWFEGSTFFVCALLQLVAAACAVRFFNSTAARASSPPG